MSRERREGESYQDYKRNLKLEAAIIRKKLQPVVIWDGKQGQARRFRVDK